jgi:hypothetical protein
MDDRSAEDTSTTTETDSGEWWRNQPHETTRAVPVTEGTAGVDVTVTADTVDYPPMVLLREYYPPEDEQDGDTIMLTGTRQVVDLARTLLAAVGPFHDPSPLPETELDDDVWTPREGWGPDDPQEGSDGGDESDGGDMLDVALTVGDVECDVSSSRVTDYGDRRVSIKLPPDSFADYIRTLRIDEYSAEAHEWLQQHGLHGGTEDSNGGE